MGAKVDRPSCTIDLSHAAPLLEGPCEREAVQCKHLTHSLILIHSINPTCLRCPFYAVPRTKQVRSGCTFKGPHVNPLESDIVIQGDTRYYFKEGVGGGGGGLVETG